MTAPFAEIGAVGGPVRRIPSRLPGSMPSRFHCAPFGQPSVERLDKCPDRRDLMFEEAVVVWFRTPNAVLADLRPLDLLSSRAGQARVKALLGKMRWGIPA